MAGALLGCDMFSSDHEGYGKTGPIEGTIKFNVEEDYVNISHVSDPEIMLLLQSEAIYPCCNYLIQADVRLRDQKLKIDLLDIYRPEIYLTVPGPATSRTWLDLPIGEIELQISDSQRIDRYRLIVTEKSIRVNPIKSSFTTPMSTLTWRYPRNSFACMCGTTTETA